MLPRQSNKSYIFAIFLLKRHSFKNNQIFLSYGHRKDTCCPLGVYSLAIAWYVAVRKGTVVIFVVQWTLTHVIAIWS